MDIRKFKFTDAQKVCDLVCTTADNIMIKYENQESIDALKNERIPEKILEKAKERDYIVIENNGIIVGIGSIKDDEIRTMFVHYNHIKEGIGTEIINELERIAKKKGYKKIIVKANVGAEGFYTKKGYKFIKKEIESIGNTSYGIIIMEKKL